MHAVDARASCRTCGGFPPLISIRGSAREAGGLSTSPLATRINSKRHVRWAIGLSEINSRSDDDVGVVWWVAADG